MHQRPIVREFYHPHHTHTILSEKTVLLEHVYLSSERTRDAETLSLQSPVPLPPQFSIVFVWVCRLVRFRDTQCKVCICCERVCGTQEALCVITAMLCNHSGLPQPAAEAYTACRLSQSLALAVHRLKSVWPFLHLRKCTRSVVFHLLIQLHNMLWW